MNKLGVIATVAILFGFGMMAYVFSKPSERETAKPINFQLQWIDQAQFAGFYIAKEKGFYRDEGLNVNIIPGGYATQPVNVVESGNAHIALAPADMALRGIADNRNISIIGMVFDRSMVCYMSKIGKNIRSPQDFIGKTVAVYKGFDTETILDIMLENHNIDKSKVDIRSAGSSMAAFKSDQIDVWPSYRFHEPLLMSTQGVSVDCLMPEKFGIEYYSDSIIISDKYLAEHPKQAKAFVRASQKGWQYALDHPTEIVDIMFKFGVNLRDDPETRKHQLAMSVKVLDYVSRAQNTPLLSIDKTRLTGMTNSLIKNGTISATQEQIDQKVLYEFVDNGK